MKFGYFLSSEEFGPTELISQAVKARDAGFESLWISDHYHPWNDAQGHGSFVWSTIGALSQAVPGMHVTTAVTCPIVRIHPAIIAQAAATSAVLLDGNFSLGLGTGEALNECILGDAWPEASVRREMLTEAIEVIRLLWEGGVKSHEGRHYRVQHARVYDLPETPPAIIVSGFGPEAIKLAAEIGDGFCTVGPLGDDVKTYRESGGGEKVVQGGLKVCWDTDTERARERVTKLWPSDALPGELAQILPTPAHFEQAAELVTPDLATESIPVGDDVDVYLETISEFDDGGFDELYVQQIGPDQDAFFEAFRDRILPQLR